MKIAAPAGCARFSVLRDVVARARRSICLGLISCAALSVGPRIEATQLLPGVYGYGTDRADNTAGFGSNVEIVHVTNLDDLTSTGGTVSGSLRHAVTKTIAGDPPRVVVFDVSGAIKLTKNLTITKPYVTIAGQAAPGPVALEGAPLVVSASNVLVQHLRLRPGDEWVKASDENVTFNRDAAAISDGMTDVVFDHCTFAWSLDEMVQGYYAYDNVTFNRCIFAEPLYIATHLDEGTFSPTASQNNPKQAETLSFTTGGLPSGTPYETVSNPTLAVDTNYHRINANDADDYVEYTISIPASSANRDQEHILISGIKGPDRGKFKAEVRVWRAATSTWVLEQTSEVFDMYAPSESQETFVSHTGVPVEFSLGKLATTMKVKLLVTGKNSASSSYKLGVDQISLSQPHGMGPYFRDGNNHRSPGGTLPPIDLDGKLSIIGSIFAHLQARGPWVGSKDLVIANNIFYNRAQQFVMLGVAKTGYAAMNAYLVGNTFIEGRNWETFTTSPIKDQAMPNGSLVRVVDNDYKHGVLLADPAPNAPPDLFDGTNELSNPTSTDDGMNGFSPLSAADAYSVVLMDAGAWPSQRDEIELRVVTDIAASANINDFRLRQGSLKNSLKEMGGWPTTPQHSAVWTEPSNPGGSAGAYTNLEIRLHELADIAEGTTSAPPTPGAYQAESATRGGGAQFEDVNAGHAGTGYVNFLTGSPTNSTLTFSNIDGGSGGAKVLRIRNAFNATSSRTGDLVVNGVTESITFDPTGSFTTWLNKDVAIALNSGTSNTIVFKSTGQDLANIDEIAIFTPSIHQAESATLGGGTALESINTGYHGTGYVNFMVGSTSTPSTLTFSSVPGGSGGGKTLLIRYAFNSTSTRTGELTINSASQPITFTSTGSFTTWVTRTLPITLNSGSSNTIALKATGQDLANVDEIFVY